MWICAWFLKNPLSPAWPRLDAVSTTALAKVLYGMLRSDVRLYVWRGRQLGARAVRPDLEQDKVVLAAEVLRHFARAFPNIALCRRCRGRPSRLVLEDLVEQRRDAGASLAGTRIAGD